MPSNERGPEIRSIYADDLQNYMEFHREREYMLLDVREPAEYEDGHIPGAKHIPLGQIEPRLHELDTDRELLFYCASGNRSRIAAAMVAASGLTAPALINVMGGFFAWDGRPLTDIPRVKVFEGLTETSEILTAAMNLEKGAWRFYATLLDRHPESRFAEAAKTLVKLEHQHAKVVYRFLKRSGKNTDLPEFDQLFEQLPGDILESGDSFDTALTKAASLPTRKCAAFADLALDIEYNAYDLYRNLSYGNWSPKEKDAFATLAEQEKGHTRLIAGMLKSCFAE